MRNTLIPSKGSLDDREPIYRPYNNYSTLRDMIVTDKGIVRRPAFRELDSVALASPSDTVVVKQTTLNGEVFTGVNTEGAFTLFRDGIIVPTVTWTPEANEVIGYPEAVKGLGNINRFIPLSIYRTTGLTLRYLEDSTIKTVALENSAGSGEVSKIISCYSIKSRIIIITDTGKVYITEVGSVKFDTFSSPVVDSDSIQFDLGINVRSTHRFKEGIYVNSGSQQVYINLANFTPTGIQVVPLSNLELKDSQSTGDSILGLANKSLFEYVPTGDTTYAETYEVGEEVKSFIKGDLLFKLQGGYYLVDGAEPLLFKREKTSEGYRYFYSTITNEFYMDLVTALENIAVFRTDGGRIICADFDILKDNYDSTIDFKQTLVATGNPREFTYQGYALAEEFSTFYLRVYDTTNALEYKVESKVNEPDGLTVVVEDLPDDHGTLVLGHEYISLIQLPELVARGQGGVPVFADRLSYRYLVIEYEGVAFRLSGTREISGIVLDTSRINRRTPLKRKQKFRITEAPTISVTGLEPFEVYSWGYQFDIVVRR